ncbi:hypothetical protein DFH09DRAFT_1302795 [Mycena vulgaris]|nr:hypothetical protein DFH09DRAFT_1302795 [Mycena vulgaris]
MAATGAILAYISNRAAIPHRVFLISDGSCLTATSNADGVPVVIQACGSNATFANSWLSRNGGGVASTLEIFGDKRLDVTDGVDADGTKLQIWTCPARDTLQVWDYDLQNNNQKFKASPVTFPKS